MKGDFPCLQAVAVLKVIFFLWSPEHDMKAVKFYLINSEEQRSKTLS